MALELADFDVALELSSSKVEVSSFQERIVLRLFQHWKDHCKSQVLLKL